MQWWKMDETRGQAKREGLSGSVSLDVSELMSWWPSSSFQLPVFFGKAIIYTFG
jgi:hypothetical protein